MGNFEDVAVQVSGFFNEACFGERANVAGKQDVDWGGTRYVQFGYKALFVTSASA